MRNDMPHAALWNEADILTESGEMRRLSGWVAFARFVAIGGSASRHLMVAAWACCSEAGKDAATACLVLTTWRRDAALLGMATSSACYGGNARRQRCRKNAKGWADQLTARNRS
ncbi:hypothetical protein [Massilia cavernae]|uniref:Uncharacterized protein n=1 Tax=Massilia cavernae TaxID=2320864 RepID=A0A418Y7F0_9BURK|nr:hypothetical protein [Massilia cavernae]RJG25876.1 hypothetical protein D3872_02425 [Massilia cavernae]